MTPQNVIDMLESRGVIDSGVADGLSQDCIHNGKEILQTIVDYGIFPNEDAFSGCSG